MDSELSSLKTSADQIKTEIIRDEPGKGFKYNRTNHNP